MSRTNDIKIRLKELSFSLSALPKSRQIVLDATEALSELEATFDLRYKADMRAIERWQKATGKELTWPDHADLVVWLLGQIDELEATAAELGQAAALAITQRNKAREELVSMKGKP